MSDCFDNLPGAIKLRLSARRGHKEWKRCANCGRYHGGHVKLRVCSGCAESRTEPVYYCDEECQRENWPSHKTFCHRGGSPRAKLSDDEAVKTVGRWLSVNKKVIHWCLEQTYFHTPTADPFTTFIAFSINGETMKIDRIGIEQRRGSTIFKGKHAKNLESTHQFYSITLESFGKKEGCLLSDSFACEGLSSPEIRKTIIGVPQYPWITVSVTGSLEATSVSSTIAERKLMLLCAVVKYHTTMDALVVPKSLIAQPIACCLHITSSQMLLWRLKLKSVDLWGPLKDAGHMASSIFDGCCPMTHARDHQD